MTKRFPDKAPGETITVTFDFSREAASVSSPVVATPTVLWSEGAADSNPATLLDGAPQINGSNPAQVLQSVTAGNDMTDYGLTCTATAPNGDVLIVAAVLPVRTRP